MFLVSNNTESTLLTFIPFCYFPLFVFHPCQERNQTEEKCSSGRSGIGGLRRLDERCGVCVGGGKKEGGIDQPIIKKRKEFSLFFSTEKLLK
mmetsp:Transcript_9231/g.10043  ORF Transcript_9231/g.10043 Transcript_9231/m.10043 type:complete len:92 (+) Transcript_9231:660-935(+)